MVPDVLISRHHMSMIYLIIISEIQLIHKKIATFIIVFSIKDSDAFFHASEHRLHQILYRCIKSRMTADDIFDIQVGSPVIDESL